MSHENVRAAHLVVDAMNRRDLDAFMAFMDPEVDGGPRTSALEGEYHGHEGVRRWLEALFATFPDFSAQIVEVRDLDDVTFSELEVRGQGAGSDVPIADTVWHVVRWRAGKCVSWRTFNKRQDALETVGIQD